MPPDNENLKSGGRHSGVFNGFLVWLAWLPWPTKHGVCFARHRCPPWLLGAPRTTHGPHHTPQPPTLPTPPPGSSQSPPAHAHARGTRADGACVAVVVGDEIWGQGEGISAAWVVGMDWEVRGEGSRVGGQWSLCVGQSALWQAVEQ